MKNHTLVVVVASTFLLAGCACVPHGSKAQKSAIESVFAQRAKVVARDQRVGLLSKQHVTELMAIKVQNCPVDFRSAWFDYLVAVQNMHTKMERVAMIAAGVGKPITDVPSLVRFAAKDKGLEGYLIGTLDKVDGAWSRLDRTAMNYGVMPER